MVGFTQRRKKKAFVRINPRKLTHAPEAAKLLRARITEYEQCRDAKCTPEWIMDKELKNYSKSLKSKCGILPKNLNAISDTEMCAHAKCTSKLYDVSRYHQMAKKQTRCVKKNCNHMQLFYPIMKPNKK
jgi:hypothetical protein